jgi:hypothetical protein
MPGGDQTGPMGMGRMIGRGAGYCASYNVPGYINPVPGRGFGRGGGWGRGQRWRNWFHAAGLPGWARFGHAPEWSAVPGWGAPTREQETEGLKAQAEWLQDQLDAVQQRIDELEKE